MSENPPETLTDQLRRIIAESGKTLGQISRDTGIDKSALSRFLSGERGVSAAVLDMLGDYLGLRFTRRPNRTKGR